MEADEPRSKGCFEMDADLYDFSIADLEERLILLRTEIDRVDAAVAQKQSGLDAAAAIFGKS